MNLDYMYGLVAGGFCTWRRTQEKQNVLRDTLKYESSISPGTNAGPVYSVAFKCQRSRPFKLFVTLLYLMRKRNCHYSQSAIMTNVRIWTLLWTRSWNQPVLSYEGKYSCSRKQGEPLAGFRTYVCEVSIDYEWLTSLYRYSLC